MLRLFFNQQLFTIPENFIMNNTELLKAKLAQLQAEATAKREAYAVNYELETQINDLTNESLQTELAKRQVLENEYKRLDEMVKTATRHFPSFKDSRLYVFGQEAGLLIGIARGINYTKQEQRSGVEATFGHPPVTLIRSIAENLPDLARYRDITKTILPARDCDLARLRSDLELLRAFFCVSFDLSKVNESTWEYAKESSEIRAERERVEHETTIANEGDKQEHLVL
jgi:hypothetical protein